MLPTVFTPHMIAGRYLTNYHVIKNFIGTLVWSDVFMTDS